MNISKYVSTIFVVPVLIGLICSNSFGEDSFQVDEVPSAGDTDQELETVLNRIKSLNNDLQSAMTKLDDVVKGNQLDGVTVLVILFAGSYLVNRITCALLTLLSSLSVWSENFPQPGSLLSSPPHEKNLAALKLVGAYYFLAAFVAIGLTNWFYRCTDTRLITSFTTTDDGKVVIEETFDFWITVFILVIGAEQIAQWLQLSGTPGAKSSDSVGPVEMTGTLVLVPETEPESK